MKKRTVLLSSLLVIILCVVLVVGSTFSLITSENKIDISLTSGEVKIKAEITGADLYSAEMKNGVYESVKQNGETFKNGGTAKVEKDGSVSFHNISAGDGVQLKIHLSNQSNKVAVKYNTTLTLLDQDKSELFEKFEKSVASDRAAKTANLSGGAAELNPDGTKDLPVYTYDDKTVRSGWVPLALEGAEKDDDVTVKLMLPVEAGNALQNQSIKIRLRLSAIQNTGNGSGITVTQDGYDCMDLQEAVHHAKDGETIELVSGDTRPAGELVIDKSLSFVSGDGEPYEFKDARFLIKEGASLTLAGLKLTGNSRVDASNATSFTMKNCIVESAPEKLFDEQTRENLDRAAFVAATSAQQAGVQLKITGNTYLLGENADADTAAILMASAVKDGSVISGNTFGSAQKPLKQAIKLAGAVRGATVSVSENAFYTENAVEFTNQVGQKAYTVKLADNIVNAEKDANLVNLISINPGGDIAVYDSGSKVNGTAVAEINFNTPNILFYGVNVAFNLNGLVTSGRFTLTELSSDDFFANYVSGGAANKNVVI